MNENVVALEQRRKPRPTLKLREFRLDEETCGLEMNLTNDQGRVFIVSYVIESRMPKDFDLDLVREAWSVLREHEEVAS